MKASFSKLRVGERLQKLNTKSQEQKKRVSLYQQATVATVMLEPSVCWYCTEVQVSCYRCHQ